MKKIIFLSIILSLTLVPFIKSQEAQANHVVLKSELHERYRCTAGDTILNTATWNYVLDISKKDKPQQIGIFMEMNKISGTPAHTIKMGYGYDIAEDSSFVYGTTITWAGLNDTMFVYQDTSGIIAPYFKILVTGSSTSKSKVDDLRWSCIDDND